MIRIVLPLLLLITSACGGVIPPPIIGPTIPLPPNEPVIEEPENLICGKLWIQERFIKCPDDSVFRWRGITWFRFLHQVSNNEDTSYLATLKDLGFNVIRVLSTAEILFDLSPEKGREELKEALDIAKEKGFYIEIVAVVDSGTRTYNWKEHARSVAETCAAADNCFFEFSNEPGHGVQDSELHDLRVLTDLCFNAVRGLDLLYSCGSWGTDEPVCLPSIEDCQIEETPHPIGSYLTPHLDRGRDKWNMVRRVRELERLSSVGKRPVINDEPIGFDELDGSITNRQRLNDCDIALAFGVLSRIMEVGTTFHLQAGLRNEVLGSIQLQCAKDFITGGRILDDNVVLSFKNAGWNDSPISSANFDSVIRVYSGINDNQGITIALGIDGDPEIKMREGWSLGELLIDRSAVKVWRVSR